MVDLRTPNLTLPQIKGQKVNQFSARKRLAPKANVGADSMDIRFGKRQGANKTWGQRLSGVLAPLGFITTGGVALASTLPAAPAVAQTQTDFPLPASEAGWNRQATVSDPIVVNTTVRGTIQTAVDGLLDGNNPNNLNGGTSAGFGDGADGFTLRGLDFGRNQAITIDDLSQTQLVDSQGRPIGNVDLSNLSGNLNDGQIIAVDLRDSESNLRQVYLYVSPSQREADGSQTIYVLGESQTPIPRNTLTNGENTYVGSPDGNSVTRRTATPGDTQIVHGDSVEEISDTPEWRINLNNQDTLRQTASLFESRQTTATRIEVVREPFTQVTTRGTTIRSTRPVTELDAPYTVTRRSEQAQPVDPRTHEILGGHLPTNDMDVVRDNQGRPVTVNGEELGTQYQVPNRGNATGRLTNGGLEVEVQTPPTDLTAPVVLTGNAALRVNPFAQRGGSLADFGIWFTARTVQATGAENFDGTPVRRPDGQQALLPHGIAFSNIQFEDHVPTYNYENRTPIRAERNGVFNLPQDREIEITAPAQLNNNGRAAYRNAGGMILKLNDGRTVFVPTFNSSGNQMSLTLGAGEASQAIPAIIQNGGEAVDLDLAYEVKERNGRYELVMPDGSSRAVISADRDPNNVVFREDVSFNGVVGAWEDTLPEQNPSIAGFDGVRRNNVLQPNGLVADTVDNNDVTTGNAAEAITRGQIPGQEGGQRQNSSVLLDLFASGGVGTSLVRRPVLHTTLSQRFQNGRVVEETRVAPGELTISQPGFNETSTPITTIRNQTRQRDFERTGTRVGNGDIQWQAPTLVGDSGISTSSRDLIGPSSTEFVPEGEATRTLRQTGDAEVVNRRAIPGSDFRVALGAPQFKQEMRERLDLTGMLYGEVGTELQFGTPSALRTDAANSLQVGVYGHTPLGNLQGNGDEGWFSRLNFFPGGSQMRPEHDVNGNPVYHTIPVYDSNGVRLSETDPESGITRSINFWRMKGYEDWRATMGEDGKIRLTSPDGQRTVLAEEVYNPDLRIQRQVSTGRPNGPGLFLQYNDSFRPEGDDRFQFGGELRF